MLKRDLVVLFAALAVRGVYVFLLVSPDDLQAEDQVLYLSMAQSILDGGIGMATSERVPGYPLFLAAVFGLFGQNYAVLLAIQALIDSLTCVAIGRMAHAMLGRGHLAAGLVSALNLNMIVLSAMILTDSLFLFLLTLALLFLFRHLQTGRGTHYFACVLFLGLATNVRPVTYYLMPALIVALAVWSRYRHVPWRQIGARALAGSMLMLALLGPQHVGNVERYGAWAFVSQGGTHLLGWVVPAAYQYSGRGSYQQGQALARESLQKALERDGMTELPSNPFAASRYQSEVASSVLRSLGWFDLAKAWSVGAALNFIAPSTTFAPAIRAMPHPSFYETPGSGIVEKLWNYLAGTEGGRYVAMLALGTLTSTIFFGASLTGAWLFLRQVRSSNEAVAGRGAALMVLLVTMYFIAVTGPIIGSKYRLPLEPIMTVCAVMAGMAARRRLV